MSRSSDAIKADFVIKNAIVVTMDGERRVLMDGALAVSGARIVYVGQSNDVGAAVDASEVIDAAGKVITPGFVNNHVHSTGDPLTRHYMPDDLNEPDRLFTWVIPRYEAHDPEDEALSTRYCAVELLKSGTTTFVEAGTIRHLDHAAEGLKGTGIRARIGAWVEGRGFEPGADETQLIDAAIKILEDEVNLYPDDGETLVAAWPILVGHNTNPDEVWCAAARLAAEREIAFTAHMSPYAADPEWFLDHVGRRPVEHLAEIGALGPRLALTHMTHIDEYEAQLVAQTKTGVVFCPFAALKGAFGVAAEGRYGAMAQAGVRFSFATDGYDPDILPVARVGAGIFKDLAGDVGAMSALGALEKITCEAAAVIGLDHEIGSLEPGKRADFVCFDTKHFQWRPLVSPLDQLLWSADARSIEAVWVDGQCVVREGRSTLVDEEELLAQAQAAADRIIARSGLPHQRAWRTE